MFVNNSKLLPVFWHITWLQSLVLITDEVIDAIKFSDPCVVNFKLPDPDNSILNGYCWLLTIVVLPNINCPFPNCEEFGFI